MILFISDLHLHESQPENIRAFLDFLSGPARSAQTLWILGDLFESWVGDGDLGNATNGRVADALAALHATGVEIRLIVGNRDFMLGQHFARRAGLQIVAEPAVIELGTHRTVLLHGDAQCTDDLTYQAFRKKVRTPWRQALFRLLPFFVQRRIGDRIRARSRQSKPTKTMGIMDVNAEAIAEAFRASHAQWMIHGHTHRPARHDLVVDGQPRVRWVLADWHGKATWLEWDGQSLQNRTA